MTFENDKKRYLHHAHRMQAGVHQKMQLDSDPTFNRSTAALDTSPKMLRVGVNASMVDHAALAKLLMAKGIITEDEYTKALASSMQAEADRYEKIIQEIMGSDKIHLGSLYEDGKE